ncbi:arylsulfatase [Pseudozyma hubeiensis SY62]|uniref:Arylsulfatase n=1 Tax=Pseudozyma hubeiensis (strain SY62) TaxID=1305764 RepID=R9PKF6_PSEHS|nr:arylsulfatase [Pseudozyma hubeiensis SY62]GAC98615.1 arylsulfatase [Pseudozyma hubeiensis SY62]
MAVRTIDLSCRTRCLKKASQIDSSLTNRNLLHYLVVIITIIVIVTASSSLLTSPSLSSLRHRPHIDIYIRDDGMPFRCLSYTTPVCECPFCLDAMTLKQKNVCWRSELGHHRR